MELKISKISKHFGSVKANKNISLKIESKKIDKTTVDDETGFAIHQEQEFSDNFVPNYLPTDKIENDASIIMDLSLYIMFGSIFSNNHL